MKKTKFRGITDRQLAKVINTHAEVLQRYAAALDNHAQAITRQDQALRWLLRQAGHPEFPETTTAVEEPVAGVAADPAPIDTLDV